MEEAPQWFQRQLGRPAVVVLFFTSVWVHTPHRGGFLGGESVNEKNPHPVELDGGSATLVAGGGFEPPTSGL